MKRSQAKREILKVLKRWEGSRLDSKTAEEILSRVEEIGMVPPKIWYKLPTSRYARSLYSPPSYTYDNLWEDELKPKRSRK